MRLRRVAPLALMLLACGAPPAAAAHTTCHSGRTRATVSGVRVFFVTRHYQDYTYADVFACGHGQKRPTKIFAGAPATDTRLVTAVASGGRVAFAVEVTADPDEDAYWVGWFDPSSHAARHALLADTDHPGLFGVTRLLVDETGSILVLDGVAGKAQSLAGLLYDPDSRRLAAPKIVYSVATGGEIVAASLTFSRGTAAYTTPAGEARTLDLATAPAVPLQD